MGVLKIGKKKEKSGDTDSKFQSIEGISRLICLTKSNHPLKVAIDGYEWAGVKFFQLSSQCFECVEIPTCIIITNKAFKINYYFYIYSNYLLCSILLCSCTATPNYLLICFRPDFVHQDTFVECFHQLL